MCSSHLGSRVIKASVSCMPSKGDYPTPLRFRRRSPAPESSDPGNIGNHHPTPLAIPHPIVLTHFVIAGHSASEDARERAYDTASRVYPTCGALYCATRASPSCGAIHPLRKKFLRRMMDHPKSGLPDFGAL